MSKLLMLLIVFSFVACLGTGRVHYNPEKTNDAMISFVQQAQAGFWKEAMENVTPDEREDMMDGEGHVLKEYREAVNRIRLSAIKNMDLGLDGRGRLVGLRDILDESNNFYRASDEKVVIDPSKLKDLSIERRKREEEEAKQMREDAEAAKAEDGEETTD
jgi:hypothetical protein